MQITRRYFKLGPEVEGSNKEIEVKDVTKDVIEVTTYIHMPFEMIYWIDSRTGYKAKAFEAWNMSAYTSFVFESIGEMNRFKEDLALQEKEHARRSQSPQALSQA